MDDGKVVEFGSPAELEAKEFGWYKEMVKKNSKEFLIWYLISYSKLSKYYANSIILFYQLFYITIQ